MKGGKDVSVQECCVHLRKVSPFSAEPVLILVNVPTLKQVTAAQRPMHTWVHVGHAVASHS